MPAALIHDLTRSPIAQPSTALPRLGILGGGQLAKMIAQAAARLGFETVILERNGQSPAAITASHAVIGDWNDSNSALELARVVDAVTIENEFVDADALAALEREGCPVYPSAASVRSIQDKLLQKETLVGAGLPVPRFRAVGSPAETAAFGREIDRPLILKRRRNGYDGKGNANVRNDLELAAGWQRLAGLHLHGGDNALFAEEHCPFVKELAVMIVRDHDGNMASYPVVETIQRNHICHAVIAPADVEDSIAVEADAIARRAVEAFDGIGVFGVELFMTGAGELLVNELAPRVHNSGHYTIEACETSQFENHVRAVFGLPLGSTAMRAPAACMINLLGTGAGIGTPIGLEDALKISGAVIHVYGKHMSAAGRKMGHITAQAETREDALALASAAANRIRFGIAEASS